MNSQEEVLEFLKKWREALANNIDFVPRGKNLDSIKAMRLTPKFALDILHNLELKNYSAGPIADTSSPDQDVWVFGFNFGKHEIYIKLKVYLCQKKWRGKCISFHKADRPLLYPFIQKP
jgi:hypothetical protein